MGLSKAGAGVADIVQVAVHTKLSVAVKGSDRHWCKFFVAKTEPCARSQPHPNRHALYVLRCRCRSKLYTGAHARCPYVVPCLQSCCGHVQLYSCCTQLLPVCHLASQGRLHWQLRPQLVCAHRFALPASAFQRWCGVPRVCT